jgi:hypothetical protein
MSACADGSGSALHPAAMVDDAHPPPTASRVGERATVDRADAEREADETLPVGTAAAEPEPSAQADITSSLPRIHSPGTMAGASGAAPERDAAPASAEPAVAAPAPEPEAMTGFPFEPSAPAPDALADYEEHELGALLRWAGIASLPAGASRRTALERLRALHRTSTEPLEACASDHPLEAGEQCLSIRTVELYRAPPGSAPDAPAADVPGPVLDPRALVEGTLETERDLSAFQRTGVCRFLLTERRLLLVAPSGQQSPLPLSRVRAVRPFRNGLEVQPRRGSPVFLAFTGGVDDVAMRIDRAARDLRA